MLFTGLILVRPPTISRALLTIDGVNNLRPERDSLFYLAAGLIAVVAALLLARMRPLRRTGTVPRSVARLLPIGVGLGAIAVATAAFLRVRRTLPLSVPGSGAYVGLAVILAAACVMAAKVTRRPGDVVMPLRSEGHEVVRRLRPGAFDLLVPLLVIALVYLPAWPQLAGNAFSGEGALHLDFFAFGPALAFRSGLALGTDLHTYYGLGWPLVFSLLDPLSYANIIRLEVVYGCVYFIGVYALLRVLVGDRRWAAAGTVLAILFQLFAGFPSQLVMWRFPSATIMRWPFDVWFFLVCALHLRTRRTMWAVAAGVLVALAVVFETDTGLALGVAFALFWACLWRMEGVGSLRRLAWSAAAGAPVALLGIGTASRWTFLSGEFWSGWLENIRFSASGATFLALTTEPPSRTVNLFVAIAVSYLVVVAYAVVQLANRRLTTSSVMLGCLATYGFFTLLYFVGRSNPYNLFRPTVPFAILLAAVGGLAHRSWVDRHPDRTPSERIITGATAWAALAVALTMLVAHPGARAYPGLMRTAIAGGPDRGVCLFENPDDVCGLPPEAQQGIEEFHALAARLRALGSTHSTVAVLDEIGPVIQFMAGAQPWGRYQPTFPNLFTFAQVDAVAADLGRDPPDLLVMRPRAEDRAFYADTWKVLRVPVERGFVLDSQQGPFEIWRRR